MSYYKYNQGASLYYLEKTEKSLDSCKYFIKLEKLKEAKEYRNKAAKYLNEAIKYRRRNQIFLKEENKAQYFSDIKFMNI